MFAKSPQVPPNFDENTKYPEIITGNKFLNKIEVRLWSTRDGKGRDKIVKKKKIPFGKKYVSFKPTRKSETRFYQINYDELKEDKKFYIYDTDVLNSLGALAFHKYPERVDSVNSQKMLVDTAVDMYVKKGGIPLWYLLIAMIGIIVLAVAVLVVVQYYLPFESAYNDALRQNAIKDTTIRNLQADLQVLRSNQ